jgi:hypothetical protein
MAVLVALIVFEAAAIMIHKKQGTNEVLHNWEVVFIVSFVVRLVVSSLQVAAHRKPVLTLLRMRDILARMM